MKNPLKTALLAAAVITVPGMAIAGSLENLERERSILLEVMFSPSIENGVRHEKLALGKRRLIDLERILLRDKSVIGRNTPEVRSAFENYDLTFLVHASVDKGLSMVDHWMEQVGVSTHSIMGSRIGRR
jgi:hypothetical protein|tara:strand:- start:1733 stop:2119 length:387 start_codon:yes stop_codon:yes gene_type:complete